MDLVIAVLAGILAGVIAALTIIAPKTKTTVDDKVLEIAKEVEPFVEGLVKPEVPPAAK